MAGGPTSAEMDVASEYHVRHGADSYGHAVGILLIECSTPFIPGDVGNASTYEFPVLYRTVPEVTLERLIEQGDETLAEPVIEAARELEKMGVRAITSDCGFMVRYQERVARAVDTPVILSSMLQLPVIERSIGAGRKVGIVTANSRRLGVELLDAAGLSHRDRAVVQGMEDQPHFRAPILDESGALDPAGIEAELVETVLGMIRRHPEIGAILLECSNLPPYAYAVQAAAGLPVFDFTTLINLYCAAGLRRPFKGFY